MQHEDSKTFLEHYETLDGIARQMAAQDRPDLDKIIPLIDEAMSSYAAIKERIKSVEALLAQRRGGADSIGLGKNSAGE